MENIHNITNTLGNMFIKFRIRLYENISSEIYDMILNGHSVLEEVGIHIFQLEKPDMKISKFFEHLTKFNVRPFEDYKFYYYGMKPVEIDINETTEEFLKRLKTEQIIIDCYVKNKNQQDLDNCYVKNKNQEDLEKTENIENNTNEFTII